jgi:hypothetical protein
MIYLYSQSTKLLVYRITDIPAGTTVAGAWWALKTSPDDPDEDAIVLVEIDTNSGAGGQITDTGSGDQDATAQFYVDLTGISDFDQSTYYYSAAKIRLSNGAVFVLPESVDTVRIRPAGVEAIN